MKAAGSSRRTSTSTLLYGCAFRGHPALKIPPGMGHAGAPVQVKTCRWFVCDCRCDSFDCRASGTCCQLQPGAPGRDVYTSTRWFRNVQRRAEEQLAKTDSLSAGQADTQ